ncbi:RrF2 family transcriptional regulator [Reinekea blandensis]|uniref:Transcriptional regulator n=1 Tax=Reinekea blandensis MED297 TaxID=314283 RepID=A4BBC5_9GAMM|nr:Rrf2 family transcriptional regulator [Reinekea blandensis]EAR10738.1 hypothetical protein MED297_12000 [Reinekea sp. MED297] [Reinekea blandensis MED297]
MRNDGRLSRVIHALLHLAAMDKPATSERLAQMLQTNPAVVRRTMAGLRRMNIVQSSKGHNGGWQLQKSLDEITLADLYEALETPQLFALTAGDEHPTCLVEQVANRSVQAAMTAASDVFLTHLRQVNLKQLEAEFKQRMAELPAWERALYED